MTERRERCAMLSTLGKLKIKEFISCCSVPTHCRTEHGGRGVETEGFSRTRGYLMGMRGFQDDNTCPDGAPHNLGPVHHEARGGITAGGGGGRGAGPR